MCGEVKSKEKEKTSSTPLVTVSDLQRLSQWETIILRLREMPFKTKLTPNYQMHWGHDFPKAKYPKRDVVEVQTFDIKSYVNAKREEKINKMLNEGGPENSMPFGGMGPSPFGGMGSTPFGGMGPGPRNDGFSRPTPSYPKPDSNFDVDDLVKRIDAKIAELEEEERLEKEKEQAKLATPAPINGANTIEPLEKDNVKPKTINGVTDDQFFDDFFNDE